MPRVLYNIIRSSITLGLLYAATPSAFSQNLGDNVESSLVRIRAFDNNKEYVASGFFVSESGLVLAPAHLLKNTDRVAIIMSDTGAEISGKIINLDKQSNFALLRVQGATGTPMNLGLSEDGPGRKVQAVGFWETLTPSNRAQDIKFDISTGAIGRLNASYFEHNAMILKDGFGGPVINYCGEIIGVNRPRIRNSSPSSHRRQKDPEKIVYAMNISTLKAFLDRNQVNYREATAVCPNVETQVETEKLRATLAEQNSQRALKLASEAQAERRRVQDRVNAERKASADITEKLFSRARDEKSRAEALASQLNNAKTTTATQRAELEAAQTTAQDLLKQAEDMQQKTETLETELENIVRDAEEAQAQLKEEIEDAQNDLKAEKEAATQERETLKAEENIRQRNIIITSIIIASLLLIGLALTIIKMRKAKAAKDVAEKQKLDAQREADRLQHAATLTLQDLLLSGRQADGNRLAVRVLGAALIKKSSLILGRHPVHSDVVVDDPNVSRQHAVIFTQEGIIFIKDSGSLNGTFVNGVRVGNNGIELKTGDILRLGGLNLECQEV